MMLVYDSVHSRPPARLADFLAEEHTDDRTEERQHG
jgi:hypothetical protein